MIIPFSEETRISGTANSWQLEMYEEANENTKWTPVSYFPNLGQAVSGAVKREVGLHPESGLTDSIIAIDGIAARYSQLLDESLTEIEPGSAT
jgi:hypothetical protein